MLENSTEQYRLFEALVAGGWVMIPLVACSVAMVALIIERFIWGPRRSRTLPANFIAQVRELVSDGRLDEAMGLCKANSSPVAAIFLAALRNSDRSREELIDATQLAGKREALNLLRYTGALGTIGAISPLMGLLGTVSGMIKTFRVIQQMGIGQSQALSGGISEALITTATGLTIAIPSVLAYRFFTARAKTLTAELEGAASEIVQGISAHARSGEPVIEQPSKRQRL